MDTFARRYESILWNAAAFGVWMALIVERPVIWPMLTLLLPLQVGVNLGAVYLHKLSTLVYWTFLFALGLGLCWICYLHFGVWWLWLFGLIPLGRIVWGIISDPTALFAEEDR